MTRASLSEKRPATKAPAARQQSLSIRQYPQFVKYMGSKTKLLPLVVSAIDAALVKGRPVCDLFAGSCSLSGAIGDGVPVISNDIQAYSGVLASAYLTAYCPPRSKITAEQVAEEAANLVKQRRPQLPDDLDPVKYVGNLRDFVACEERNRALVDRSFDFPFHLFTRYYSGTWWTAEQCLWIDAIREVADGFKQQPTYNLILASLMYAMAYASQGTGHYAQYRDAKDEDSMRDIAMYRARSVSSIFTRKLQEVLSWAPTHAPRHAHTISVLDYKECLANTKNATVYADPPYCFVHYSRFYHALETLVLYDYPPIQRENGKYVKGRYREYRHQSPFCIESQVRPAFGDLFAGIAASRSNLVLSYSNTGMIELEELIDIAQDALNSKYSVETLVVDHVHMTMGRRDDRQRNVKECLITAVRK